MLHEWTVEQSHLLSSLIVSIRFTELENGGSYDGMKSLRPDCLTLMTNQAILY